MKLYYFEIIYLFKKRVVVLTFIIYLLFTLKND